MLYGAERPGDQPGTKTRTPDAGSEENPLRRRRRRGGGDGPLMNLINLAGIFAPVLLAAVLLGRHLG